MDKMFKSLVVNKDRMLVNLERAGSVIMAEAVMMALVAKGMGRQDAHELVRKCSMAAQKECVDFKSFLMREEGITSLLSEKELDAAIDPKNTEESVST